MENDKHRNYKIWQPLLLGVVAALGFYGGLKAKLPEVHRDSTGYALKVDNAQKLRDVLAYVHAQYQDSLDENWLIDLAIQNFIQTLDPYSEYIPTRQVHDANDLVNGIHQSYGTDFIYVDSNLVLFNVDSNSVVSKQGLRNGDVVIRMNGRSMQINAPESQNQLDSIYACYSDSLEVEVMSVITGQIKSLRLMAEKREQSSIPISREMGNGIAYVKISEFTKGTYRNFMETLEDYLGNKGNTKIIIDLRGNTGGLIGEVASILNQLVDQKNVLLFQTKGRSKKSKDYLSTGKTFFRIDQIALLVDSCTASAAELFALSLQDLGKARVYGDTTFGKATILEQFELSDGSSIRLAIGHFTTQSKRDIQRHYMHSSASSGPINTPRKNVNFPYGVLPDETNERNTYWPWLSEASIEWMDKYILDNIHRFIGIVGHQPERIFEDPMIDKEISIAFSLRPKSIVELDAKEQFKEQFRFGLCAWLFHSDLEQRARLDHDPLVKHVLLQLNQQQ